MEEWGGWAVQSVPGPALHHRADAALKHNGGIFDDADPSQSRIASVYFLQQTTPGVWAEVGGGARERRLAENSPDHYYYYHYY